MSLFGAYDFAASNRFLTWNSTCNYLQTMGFYYKDCAYLIDDFKPETTRHGEVVRLLQNYADGTGRGRLRADATTNVVRPIRGLLISTGEDFPMQNASGLARSIVVAVPNREKDLELGARCLAMRHRYRGVMADFIAGVIRADLGARFKERVEHWQGVYHHEIAGHQNDARIAGNHALLAAAFEQFAGYLDGVWPEAGDAAREFAEEDLQGMVLAAAKEAEREQASSIFLETLRELLRHERVRIVGLGKDEEGRQDRIKAIGKLAAREGSRRAYQQAARLPSETVVEVSIAMALEAVQESLRLQVRPPLQVSARTLIQQLVEAGLLLDDRDEPIDKGHEGLKSREARLDGTKTRRVRMRVGTLLDPDERTDVEAAPLQLVSA